MTRPLYILAAVVALICIACKKDSFIKGSGAAIEISADSLHFDTLFTGTGSVTQAFKIFNRNNQKLLISSISLEGGNGSGFKINADGFEGPQVNNIEMAANDSLYVFVTVMIDPSSPGLPFIVQDSIGIQFNGNKKWVQLDAWGQNANFLRGQVITANSTWTAGRPYVILDSLKVAENAVLTIEKGVKIYLHSDAPLLVDGTLHVNGEKDDSSRVVFSSDRLDDPYNTYPGAWPGIYFRENSKRSVLVHTVVKNANQGIVVQGPATDADPKLKLDKCIISNCFDAGLLGTHTNIEAVNCLIFNCGRNISFEGGGDYSMKHCTVAAYSNLLIAHKAPALSVNDFVQSAQGTSSYDLHASFINCIFWGENGIVDDEVVAQQQGSGIFDINFQNCLWKVKHQPMPATSSGMVENQDPRFSKTDARNNNYDFHLSENSPALEEGIDAGVTTDLDENPRDMNFPDLGAYEATF